MRAVALSLGAAGALAAGAYGADRALDAAPAPHAALSYDAARPVFILRNLRSGDRAKRCVTVTNDGPDAARVAVLGRTLDEGLARHLRLTVTRAAACSARGDVVFDGPITSLRDGRFDPAVWARGDRRVFRLELAVVGDDAALQGTRATQELTFAAEPVRPDDAGDAAPAPAPAATAPSTQAPAAARPRSCRRLRFKGRKRRAVLVKWAPVKPRVRAKLILRLFGTVDRQHLVVTTGLRVRGKTLLLRGWARVTYRVGRRAYRARVRPFRVRVLPGALKVGRNRVRIRIAPHNSRPVGASFRLTVKRTRTACVVS